MRLYTERRARPAPRVETDLERAVRELRLRVLSYRHYESLWLTWRCVTCRGEWTEDGSYAAGKCTRCGTARP